MRGGLLDVSAAVIEDQRDVFALLPAHELRKRQELVASRIEPLPGHTPGSLIVMAGDAAFVGDLIRGGVVFSQSPTEHFYHENRSQAREQLKTLAQSGVRMIFPGLFGPLSMEDVKSYNE